MDLDVEKAKLVQICIRIICFRTIEQSLKVVLIIILNFDLDLLTIHLSIILQNMETILRVSQYKFL